MLIGSNALAGIGIALMYLAVPTATAIAILRDDLFDVDRALSSAVLCTALSLAVVGTYAVAAVVAGVLFGPWIRARGGRCDGPARHRPVAPADPAATTRRWLADLQHRTNTGEAVPEELEAVLRAALRDPGLRVSSRAPGAAAYVDIGLAAERPDIASSRRVAEAAKFRS